MGIRFSRHARNRLRYIRRDGTDVTEEDILGALGSGEMLGRVAGRNRRERLRLSGIVLVVIVDRRQHMVITLWKEDR